MTIYRVKQEIIDFERGCVIDYKEIGFYTTKEKAEAKIKEVMTTNEGKAWREKIEVE